MQVFSDLIAGIGNILGIDGLAPDAEGVCIIAAEEAEILIIDCTEDANSVLLTATIMPMPPDPHAAAIASLKANYGFRMTRGGTISFDPDTCNLVLSRYLPFSALQPEDLVTAIEEFSSALLAIRHMIEGSVPESATEDDNEEGIQASENERETTLDIDGVVVSLRTEEDGNYIVATSELQKLTNEKLGPFLREMGIANHLFSETAGATLSLNPDTNCICLQQRFWANEGGAGDDEQIARRTAVFADKVREWKERLEQGAAPNPLANDSFDSLSGFIKV